MIFEIRIIKFKKFIREYKMLDPKDRVWLLSLIHNSHTLEYFQILNNENITVGIGSVRYGELMNEVSFAFFSNHKLKGHGSSFIGFILRVLPGSCFKVSQFNVQSMSLFRKNQKRLNLKCSCDKSTYTFYR
jgi:hypothetical protein